MEDLMNLFLQFMFILIFVALAVYIVSGIILFKLNKAIYGKGSPMAWIPIFNIYLLGKLTINKLVGWILVICLFLSSSYTTTVNGKETTQSILPEGISSILSQIYSLVLLVLFIYAIVKLVKLQKAKKKEASSTVAVSPAPSVPQQSVTEVQPTVSLEPHTAIAVNPAITGSATLPPQSPINNSTVVNNTEPTPGIIEIDSKNENQSL